MNAQSRLRRASLALIPFVAACSDPSSPLTPESNAVVQLPRAAASASAAVQDEYIVTFDASETDPVGRARALVAQQNGQLHHTYQHAIRGFSAQLPPQAAAALARTPGVKSVEPDITMNATETVAAVSWGLDRLDQRSLPLDNSYTFNSRGSGVRVYIVDTGLRLSHSEFGGRAVSGYTAINDGNGTNDCHGHGTHVGGTVGGSSAGVARGVTLVAVRVLDCGGSGSNSGVIAGIDYIVSQKNANPSVPMVANMSLGGGFSSALNDAVGRAVSAGVTFAVAAGNSNVDACTSSPASSPSALTVGATEANDARAYFSNYGSCLDIFAPGTNIVSSWIYDDWSMGAASGTSMASPHVAGVAALILGDYPSASPASVRTAMLDGANQSVTNGAGSTSALLTNLYSAPSTSTPPPTQPPTTQPTPPAPVSISLSVAKARSGKFNNATLTWSGATASTVSVYRNGALVANTANDGSYSENKLSAGSYGYKVCQSTICSATITVTF